MITHGARGLFIDVYKNSEIRIVKCKSLMIAVLEDGQSASFPIKGLENSDTFQYIFGFEEYELQFEIDWINGGLKPII